MNVKVCNSVTYTNPMTYNHSVPQKRATHYHNFIENYIHALQRYSRLFIKKMYQYEYNDWGIALIRLSITFHTIRQLICSLSIHTCGYKHTDDCRCCMDTIHIIPSFLLKPKAIQLKNAMSLLFRSW